MKISASELSMASNTLFAEKHEVRESLSIRASSANIILSDAGRNDFNDRISISEQSKALLEELKEKEKKVSNEIEDELKDPRKYVAMLILKALFGKDIEIFEIEDLEKASENDNDLKKEISENPPPQLEIAYEYHESHYEYQEMNFSAKGKVRTQDGKEISFSLNLSMMREFYSESSINFRSGNAVDPLIINYSGSAADLSNAKFLFDLNADGTDESISFVKPGSGFLVFDKNEDGVVNDGSELFGPSTGSGFGELGLYDEDSNGWIDENDSIYNRLSLWTKDDAGNDILSGLKEKYVGAISLSKSSTGFDLKDSANNLHGRVKQSGIYLKESGGVGTVQELDLSV
jgi:hypothetical protein